MGSRSTKLSHEEKAFLLQEKGTLGGWKKVVKKYNKSEKTLRDLIREGDRGVDHTKEGNEFRAKLAFEMNQGKVALHADLNDPEVEIHLLLKTGTELHFEKYQPIEAFVYLDAAMHRIFLFQLPAESFFRNVIKILTIYRQSKDVGTGSFLSIAQMCVKRLIDIPKYDMTDRLAALVCATAWELTAAAVQRGQTNSDSLHMLDRIESIFRAKNRLEWLAVDGIRPESMTRMLHMAKVISISTIKDAKTICKSANPTNVLRATTSNPKERNNINLQLLMQKTRFALNDENRLDNAIEFFSTHIEPDFNRLASAAQHADLTKLQKMVTPSTALGIATQSIVVAKLKGDLSGEVAEKAKAILDKVNEISHSAILFQNLNDETDKCLKPKSGKVPVMQLAEMSYVSRFQVRPTQSLLSQVSLLLDSWA